MSIQGNMQESFQAIHGGDPGSFNSDAILAMTAELEAALADVPANINGIMIAWLQLRLSSSNTSLQGLWAEFEAAEPDGAFDPL